MLIFRGVLVSSCAPKKKQCRWSKVISLNRATFFPTVFLYLVGLVPRRQHWRARYPWTHRSHKLSPLLPRRCRRKSPGGVFAATDTFSNQKNQTSRRCDESVLWDYVWFFSIYMILYICFYKYDFIHDYTYVWLHNDYIHIWIKKTYHYILSYIVYPNKITSPKTTNRCNISQQFYISDQKHVASLSCNSPKPPCRCQSMATCNQSSLHLGTEQNWQTNTWTSNVKHDSKHKGKILDKVLVTVVFRHIETWNSVCPYVA